MKRAILVIAVALISCERPMNQEIINYEGETILIGNVDWDGLTTSSYGNWFITGYQDYVVDSLVLQPLVGQLSDIDILVFVGTWCDDSKYQLPQLYKILDYLKYDLDKLEVVALERLEDRRLVGPGQQDTGYEIGFVPTYIFKRNGEEVGRIIEFPEQSLEKDMVSIISTP